LRTNALVAVGSAAFVALATVVEGENSPTRIAAQVASGIGFLGAGVIMREGAGLRGLNTSATLWGAASVGVLAGSGYPLLATAAALLVILSNVLLRPLARQIDQVNAGASELGLRYTLCLVCQQANELHIRALLVQMLSTGPLILRSLDSVDIEDTDRVRVEAEVIARLSLESGVSAVSWAAAIESD